MKIVEIKDLEIGDRIVVPFQSVLRTFIVAKKPSLKNNSSTWQPYSSVRCTARYDWEFKQYIRTFDNHNKRINVNLRLSNKNYARAIKQIDWSANFLCDDYLNANTLLISIVQREYCESFSKTFQHDETRALYVEESD